MQREKRKRGYDVAQFFTNVQLNLVVSPSSVLIMLIASPKRRSYWFNPAVHIRFSSDATLDPSVDAQAYKACYSSADRFSARE